jgi:hypothetical protein
VLNVLAPGVEAVLAKAMAPEEPEKKSDTS